MQRRKQPAIALPAHVRRVRSRGHEYYYFHPDRGTERQGKAVRLPGTPQDLTFWKAYHKLLGTPEERPNAGTFNVLIKAYRSSPEFKGLAASSRDAYGRSLDRIAKIWGKLAVPGVEPKHVLKLRDSMANTPAAANYVLRVLSVLMAWGVPRGYRTDNPCVHVRKLKSGEGYAPWSMDAIGHFEANATPELWWAAALALYTGQRQSDVLAMKWSDIEDGLIAVKQEKTGKRLWLPIHQKLGNLLASIPRRSINIATTTRGQPWGSGFKASWRREMARPGMKSIKERGLVFHGLRKSSVVMLLEAGCTDAEVSAITGQTREMVEHYAQQVNQRRLAGRAILKWEQASDEHKKNV